MGLELELYMHRLETNPTEVASAVLMRFESTRRALTDHYGTHASTPGGLGLLRMRVSNFDGAET